MDQNLSLKDLKELLAKKLAETYESAEAVSRQGNRIVIPAHMSYEDAAAALLDHQKQQETVIETRLDFAETHPDDAIVCFNRALKRVFGNLVGMPNPTFFGLMPPQSVSIPVGYNRTEPVFIGMTALPGLPIKMNIFKATKREAGFDGAVVIVSHARKYLPLVKDIEKEARLEMQNNSIFKGQAFDSNHNFISIDVDRSRIVYNADEERRIERSILVPIRNLKALRAAGIQRKRGVLLHGVFGTGKSLTSALAAQEATKNGWTFISVKPGQAPAKALETARRYAPAIVFIEDIDVAVETTERNNELNGILETFDGIISKNTEVMVIMTTNRIEAIHRAMLRPGRLDDIIELRALKGEAIGRFVTATCRDEKGDSVLAYPFKEKEYERIAEQAGVEGMVPAFLAEAVKRAKLSAITRSPGAQVQVDLDDVLDGIESVKPQIALMNTDQAAKQPALNDALGSLVADKVKETLRDQFPSSWFTERETEKKNAQ